MNRLRKLAKDDHGAVLVYVTIILGVLGGAAILAVDIPRAETTHSQLQAAADAAALAGARQLDRGYDAIERAQAAAAQALQNYQDFADGGGSAVAAATTPCSEDATPPTGCMRFLKSLPASDASPIDSTHVTTLDEEARFIEVRLPVQAVSSPFLAFVGGGPAASIGGRAVAGNDRAMCSVPPLFICNPTEPGGNIDINLPVDLEALDGKQLKIFYPNSGGYFPGNFGLLCPPDNPSCNATDIRDMLGSTQGAGCINAYEIGTKPGVNEGMVKAGFDARFDNYYAQTKDWVDDPNFAPAANVTQGGVKTNLGQQCYREPDTSNPRRARGMPRDDTFTGHLGAGDWNHAEYFRVNHGGDGTDAWRPADWVGVTGMTSSTKPNRYDVYRYEIEGSNIVEPDQPISYPSGTEYTVEDGSAQCYQGTVSDTIDYLPDRRNDQQLLLDRRVTVVAVLNCNAYEGLQGRTGFKPSQFLYMFFTEPFDEANKTIHAELLAPTGEALDEVIHDVVQIYRR